MFLNFLWTLDYAFSFFFFIDLFALMCLMTDVPYFETPMFNPLKLTYIDKSVKDRE